jgi:hypothetical protein
MWRSILESSLGLSSYRERKDDDRNSSVSCGELTCERWPFHLFQYEYKITFISTL